MELGDYVRTIQDFPKKGIGFKDITPMLSDPGAFRASIDAMCDLFMDAQVDTIAAFDARGFIYGSAMAYRQNVPLVPIRKAGKLPYETIGQDYGLEYGSDCVEMHIDAVKEGDSVLLIDDLLATGGTMRAGCSLVERLGGTVAGCGFLVELDGIGGRDALAGYDVRSVLRYEG